MANIKAIPGGATTPKGFSAAAVYTAIKKRENKKPDVAILYSELPCSCAACFTTNKFCAAPVILDREILKKGKARAVVVNSGNANAATGKQGIEDALTVEREAEKLLGLGEDEVFVSSTGVIGQRLPVEKVLEGVRRCVPLLSPENGSEAAYAIMTTDTVRKECAYELQLSAGTVRIGAMAKGAGMIHPNMATMLAFITTDLGLPLDFFAEFRADISDSFNAITVDGDTSTNDTCILLANGVSGIKYEDLSISEKSEFRAALMTVMKELAKDIARDGEGATKFIEIRIEKAESHAEALKMARFIGTSNLAKCAMFGEDPNWGRILSSAGSSGVNMVAEQTDLYFGDVKVLEAGRPIACDQKKLEEVVKQKEYAVTVVLNIGEASASAYTCDLSYEYVKINAEYTT